MKHLRRVLSSRHSLLAAALAVCLAPRPLTAQIGPAGPGNNYYPRTDAPINDNDVLEPGSDDAADALTFIESLLHDQYRKVKDTITPPSVIGQTVHIIKVPSLLIPDASGVPALPPVPGDDNKNDFPTAADHYIVASDIELDIAIGSAVQKLLDGTAASASTPYTGSLSTLIGAASSYRTKSIKAIIKTATTNILNWQSTFSASVGGSQVEALKAVTIAACEADPAAAAGVVATMLPLVVPKVKGSIPPSPVLLGTAQIARTPSTTLTTASVSTALNSIPEVAKKGGVRVEVDGANLRVHFGSTSALVSPTATALDFQTALNGLGLNYYGQFTVATDADPLKQPVVAFRDDFVISYKPINLNRAGAANWNATPGFAEPGAGNAVDQIMRAAMEKAAVNAVAIVTSALGVVMQGVDTSGTSGNPPTTNGTLAKAKQHAQEVSAIAVNTAFTYGRGYLADEIAVAIGTKVKAANYVHAPTAPGVKKPIATSAEIAQAIFADPTHPTDLKDIGLIAAGLMKGFKGSIFEGGVGGTFIDADKPEENIAEQIKTTLGLNAGGQSYVDNVQGGFESAYTAALPTNAHSVAASVLAGINAGNVNEIAARLTGAAAWLPAALVAKSNGVVNFTNNTFIADLLQKDADLSGNDTITDIVEAATRGSFSNAGNIANFATTWAKNATSGGLLETQRLGQITRGAALGLKGQPLYNSLLNGVVSKVMAGAPLTKVTHKITNVDDNGANPLLKSAVTLIEYNAAGRAQMKEITSFALDGAVDAGHPTAAAGVAFTLAKAAMGFHQFYQPILEGAIDSAAGGSGALAATEQWRAVLAVMAPKKLASLEFDGTYDTVITPLHPKPTANFQTLYSIIPTFAATVPEYNAGNNAQAIAKGGAVIKNIQDFPKAAFIKAYDGFVDVDVQADLTLSKAVLTALGLASPKDAPLAGALGVKFRPADSETFKAEAIGLNPALAANVTVAVDTAKHISNGTADLFDYLNNNISKNSKYLADIVTGATVVVPGYAHIIGHAVAFSSPANVAKAVPNLFNYSSITSADPLTSAPQQGEYENRVDAASAVSAAITAGILEAKTSFVSGSGTATKQTVETANLKNAVVAMVKQVLTVTGNTPVNSQWLAGSNPDLSFGATGHDGLAGGGEGDNNFMQSDGTTPVLGGSQVFSGGYTLQKQVGPAGIITGFMSQVMTDGDTTLPTRGHTVSSAAGPAIGMVGQILAAAVVVVQADVSKVLAIAQAAAQAARGVSTAFSSTGAGNGDGEAAIVAAILYAFDKKISGVPFPITSASHPSNSNSATLANGKPNPYYQIHIKVANAVHFGRLAAENQVPGAGAAGVINYTHASLSGSPITDIFGL